jgi:imidazole glycerol-phosphate synthase subunit HisF
MFRPRIIPVLLLKGKGLVKTKKFKNPNYIGDPINAVRIFNDLEVDELIFLDINASKERRSVSLDVVKDIGDEAFMPFGVGGGINDVNTAIKVINSGAEKIIINTAFHRNESLISEVVKELGSQSVVVSIDVGLTFWGKRSVKYLNGTKNSKYSLIELVKKAEDLGAGEIMVNSISNDGMMTGYDFTALKEINNIVNIPIIISGGAGKLTDFQEAYKNGAHAMAAGSMFVYHGSRSGVLINYPSPKELKELYI